MAVAKVVEVGCWRLGNGVVLDLVRAGCITASTGGLRKGGQKGGQGGTAIVNSANEQLVGPQRTYFPIGGSVVGQAVEAPDASLGTFPHKQQPQPSQPAPPPTPRARNTPHVLTSLHSGRPSTLQNYPVLFNLGIVGIGILVGMLCLVISRPCPPDLGDSRMASGSWGGMEAGSNMLYPIQVRQRQNRRLPSSPRLCLTPFHAKHHRCIARGAR